MPRTQGLPPRANQEVLQDLFENRMVWQDVDINSSIN